MRRGWIGLVVHICTSPRFPSVPDPTAKISRLPRVYPLARARERLIRQNRPWELGSALYQPQNATLRKFRFWKDDNLRNIGPQPKQPSSQPNGAISSVVGDFPRNCQTMYIVFCLSLNARGL